VPSSSESSNPQRTAMWKDGWNSVLVPPISPIRIQYNLSCTAVLLRQLGAEGEGTLL
jgi:hypothetical protein